MPNSNIEVSADGEQFRWTFDRDGAEYLATELHPDGTSREMHRALNLSDELRRQVADMARYGFTIVMVPRDPWPTIVWSAPDEATHAPHHVARAPETVLGADE